jgi:uncharacterized RDD family membrane protein YckC
MNYQAQAQAPVVQSVGVWPRFLAALVDSIIFGILGGILSAILGTQQATLSGSFVGVLAIVYYIVMEATQGATLGKMALGLRVVRVDGAPISWSESIIRNLLRIVDSLFGYLLGAIFIWTSPLKQRLGDKVAKTVVVKSR